jgi:hypothetical protein
MLHETQTLQSKTGEISYEHTPHKYEYRPNILPGARTRVRQPFKVVQQIPIGENGA